MSDLQNVRSMSIVRMPKECFDFMKRNPQLTQIVGQAIMEIHTAKKHMEDIEAVLKNSADLRKMVENGTPEEVESFIQAALTGASLGVMDFNDMEPGVAEEVKRQLGEDVFTTEIAQVSENPNNN